MIQEGERVKEEAMNGKMQGKREEVT